MEIHAKMLSTFMSLNCVANFDLSQFLNKGMIHNEKKKKKKLMRILFTLLRNVLLEIQSKILLCTKKHFPVKKCTVLLD